MTKLSIDDLETILKTSYDFGEFSEQLLYRRELQSIISQFDINVPTRHNYNMAIKLSIEQIGYDDFIAAIIEYIDDQIDGFGAPDIPLTELNNIRTKLANSMTHSRAKAKALKIIDTEGGIFGQTIKQYSSTAKSSIDIAVPFIDNNKIVRELIDLWTKKTNDDDIRVRIISRWSKGLSKHVRESFQDSPFVFYDNTELHAKLYTFDNNKVITGSANLTYPSLFRQYEHILALNKDDHSDLINQSIDNFKNLIKVSKRKNNLL